MKNSTFAVLLSICIVILLAGTYQPKNAEKTTIAISGLHCDNCVKKVQSALVELKGINSASVDLEKSIAEITYNPKEVKLEDMKTVIAGLGYAVDAKSAKSKCTGMNEEGCSHKKEGASGKSCSEEKSSGSI